MLGRGRLATTATATLVALVAGACTGSEPSAAPATPQQTAADAEAMDGGAADELGTRLADVFRIDLTDLDVSYDYWPADERVDGTAVLRFVMRPGQTRALFHFNPVREGTPERTMLESLRLDGEALDPADDADLLRIRPAPSAEPAFELQRDLTGGDSHTLRVRWSMPAPGADNYPGWLVTDFDDTVGPRDETETLWPTISSPEELVRHHVRVRVHADRPYTVLGSGTVRPVEGDGAQTWDLDSGRAIASHTMLVAAVPAAQVRTERFETSGVDVRIVSDRDVRTTTRAGATVRRAIARLTADLGPFPMPRMQILLTGWGSGMEYYGATRTGIGALEHELGHMYFGAVTVNRTWRDTWIDESAVTYWEYRGPPRRLPTGFESDIADGRTAVEVGFDGAAYGAGAKVLGEIGLALGGRQPMLEFLADLHARRAYDPFTTDELIDDAVTAQDSVDRDDLEGWLFSGR